MNFLSNFFDNNNPVKDIEKALDIVKPIVNKAVKVTEEKHPDSPSKFKHDSALVILEGIYDFADVIWKFPTPVDVAVKSLLPLLINQAVDLYNQTGLFSHNKEK